MFNNSTSHYFNEDKLIKAKAIIFFIDNEVKTIKIYNIPKYKLPFFVIKIQEMILNIINFIKIQFQVLYNLKD